MKRIQSSHTIIVEMGRHHAFYGYLLIIFQPGNQFLACLFLCRGIKDQCFPSADYDHPVTSHLAKVIRAQVADVNKSVWTELLDLERFGSIEGFGLLLGKSIH